MKKRIQIISSSSYLRESGIDNNRWGWLDESTNSWEILPELTYAEAMCFDFNKFYKEIDKFKARLVKKILKDKRLRAKIEAYDSEEIELLKKEFGVKHIKYACQNFSHELCSKVSNKSCYNCVYRFNDYESLTNKIQ